MSTETPLPENVSFADFQTALDVLRSWHDGPVTGSTSQARANLQVLIATALAAERERIVAMLEQAGWPGFAHQIRLGEPWPRWANTAALAAARAEGEVLGAVKARTAEKLKEEECRMLGEALTDMLATHHLWPPVEATNQDPRIAACAKATAALQWARPGVHPMVPDETR